MTFTDGFMSSPIHGPRYSPQKLAELAQRYGGPVLPASEVNLGPLSSEAYEIFNKTGKLPEGMDPPSFDKLMGVITDDGKIVSPGDGSILLEEVVVNAKGISARSQKSAYAETGDMASVCLACKGPVRIEAHYDDPWKTPITGALVRIEDLNGALLPGAPGGPTTLGLVNFGAQDGQPVVPALRPELGTFMHPQAQRGPVKIALTPDPSAKSEADGLVEQILSLVSGFQSEMETALLPWITKWNEKGLLSIPEAYRTGATKGLSEWWKGEAEFWSSIDDWISSAFEEAVHSAKQAAVELWNWYNALPWWGKINPLGYRALEILTELVEKAHELWERRDEIMLLVKGFVSGSVNVIEKGLEALLGFPGEVGAIVKLLVLQSAEWAGGLNEMIRETDVIEKLSRAFFGIIMMMTPNLWAEAIGTIGGYLLPEVLIAIVFIIIGAFSGGSTAPAFVGRIATFVSKIKSALAAAGKIGPLLLKIFAKLDEIAELLGKLSNALRRNIDEAVDSATDLVTKIVRRGGKRIKPAADIPCFNKPAGVSDREFLEQLAEQENAINNSDISELTQRRDMVKNVGTGALRDKTAQQAVRKKWTAGKVAELVAGGMTPSQAKRAAAKEAAMLDATHVLDIVAGGDPSAISGLQNRSVNRSLGSQWAKGGRVAALDNALADHAAQGGEKANVKLKKC